jgi:hypothetical protein
MPGCLSACLAPKKKDIPKEDRYRDNDLSQSGSGRARFPPPIRDTAESILFAVSPMSYENWAFEGLDANGLVGFQVSEFGFRILTTARGDGPNRERKVLKEYPLALVDSWSGTQKIFRFTFLDKRTREQRVCQLTTTHVPIILSAIDEIVRRLLNKRKARQMPDLQFAAMIVEVESLEKDSNARGERITQWAESCYATTDQARAALRCVPADDTYARVTIVVTLHRRMVFPAEFDDVIAELKDEAQAESAWELVNRSRRGSRSGDSGKSLSRSNSGSSKSLKSAVAAARANSKDWSKKSSPIGRDNASKESSVSASPDASVSSKLSKGSVVTFEGVCPVDAEDDGSGSGSGRGRGRGGGGGGSGSNRGTGDARRKSAMKAAGSPLARDGSSVA